MEKKKGKINLRLIGGISVLAIVVMAIYFFLQIKKNANTSASFISLDYNWGIGDSLQNHYSSVSGTYRYLDQRDRVINKVFKLRSYNIIYLNSKINQEDLFNIPDTLINKGDSVHNDKVLRYEMDFKYEKQHKKIVFMSNYHENPVYLERAIKLQKLVEQMVNEAEQRSSKN